MNRQPKRADDIWTKSEFNSLCYHLHNGNGPTQFVMGFRDRDGCKQYKRSKRWPADRIIPWAWASISKSPMRRIAFVPYSTNERQQSRWGGMDFDAHHVGQAERARELAFAAFRLLLNQPDLAVILETSGSGGWHVWAISMEFHDIHEWIRLLKSVASHIGTTISAGVCEIFPPDSLPSRFGKGMRAPGCWNPATDTFSEIYWENTHTSLGSVLSRKLKIDTLNGKDLENHFLDKRNKYLSLPLSYREADLLRRLGINLPNTRNMQLSSLVGEVFHQVSHKVARQLAEAQFRAKTVSTRASESEHMASFESLWNGLANGWEATLSVAERNLFATLETENERDAFRIVRSYARNAKKEGMTDFPIVRDNLGERLGITGNGAAWIRDKFVKLGVIAKTANYVPNKFAARFKWIVGDETALTEESFK
jgi:hypothetical protein